MFLNEKLYSVEMTYVPINIFDIINLNFYLVVYVLYYLIKVNYE